MSILNKAQLISYELTLSSLTCGPTYIVELSFGVFEFPVVDGVLQRPMQKQKPVNTQHSLRSNHPDN